MKYIITERQYKLIEEEEELLKIHFEVFNDDWDLLQKYINKRNNPPYELIGDLDLQLTDVKTLGSLVKVNGFLDLSHTKIESLGELKHITGSFYFQFNYTIKSFENLKSVGGELNLRKSKIQSLGSLTSVGGNLNLQLTNVESLGNLKYVGGSLELYQTPLSVKYTKSQIKDMVTIGIGGSIYFL